MNLPLLDISYKWNHTICGFLCHPLSVNVFSRFINELVHHFMASLKAQLVKNPPAMQEILVGFLGWEDPLGKG